MAYGGITPETVRDLVHGCIFTRGPKDLRHTAIRKAFFGPMRVSVMLDSNGSNTTAVAAVAKVVQAAGGDVTGARAVVTAGTGPVGMRAAGLLAKAGADVTITSRRAVDASFLEGLQKRFGGTGARPISAVTMSDAAQAAQVLDGAALLVSAGPAGVCMVPRAAWAGRTGLRVA